MPDIRVLTGQPSHLTLGSDINVATNNAGGVSVNKTNVLSFRLGNTPVLFHSSSLPSLTESDSVAVAGPLKGGTLHAYALRNLTTGIIYSLNTTLPLIALGVVFLIGIPLIALLGLGLIFCAASAWGIYKLLQIRKSTQLLLQQSPATPAAAPPPLQPT